MAAVEKPPARKMSDLDYAVRLATTGGSDPGFQARIEAESDRITREIRERHGVLDVAVDVIREVRDA